MWNARKAQLDLETGGRHQLAQRSRPRSPSPAAEARHDAATEPRLSKRQRNGHSSGRTGSEACRQRSFSLRHSSSGGEGSPDGSFADGEALQHPEAPSEEEVAAVAERQLEELLSKSRVRGRGAVGPRADEPGPYLPASATGVVIFERPLPVRTRALSISTAALTLSLDLGHPYAAPGSMARPLRLCRMCSIAR